MLEQRDLALGERDERVESREIDEFLASGEVTGEPASGHAGRDAHVTDEQRGLPRRAQMRHGMIEDAALVVGELERGDRGPHEAWVQRDLRERHASGGANAFDHRGCDDRTEDREEQPVLLGLRERFDERPVEQASRGVRLGEDRERGR